MSRPLIHLIDDDQGVLDSLSLRLRVEGWAVATHESAVAFLESGPPAEGCVLSDFRMPGMTGIELQQQLSARSSRVPVILMTGQGDVPLAVQAMRAGAIDFLEKPVSDERLFEAISRALAAGRAERSADETSREAAGKLDTLTAREREVLELLVVGRTSKQIARLLDISPRTIDVHRSRVFHKLGVETLPDLVYLHLAASQAP